MKLDMDFASQDFFRDPAAGLKKLRELMADQE